MGGSGDFFKIGGIEEGLTALASSYYPYPSHLSDVWFSTLSSIQYIFYGSPSLMESVRVVRQKSSRMRYIILTHRVH